LLFVIFVVIILHDKLLKLLMVVRFKLRELRKLCYIFWRFHMTGRSESHDRRSKA